MKLKLAIGLTAGALALGTAPALAQKNHDQMNHAQMNHGQMQGQMNHGPGMHHGPMHGGENHGGMNHGGMNHGGMMNHGGAQHGAGSQTQATPKGDTSPSSLAFQGINQKMHDGMNIAFTGNADADFVRGMIPHHQGAVDMAKVVLAFGKDPQICKLAEEIVKAQESEIALMQEWLRTNAR